jgi:hypothetical protein
MASSRIVPENFLHPDEFYKGLEFKPQEEFLSKEFVKSRRYEDSMCNTEHHDLCWACGWSTHEQLESAYGPRIRVIMARYNRGLWVLGSQLLLKDIPNTSQVPGNDCMTYR